MSDTLLVLGVSIDSAGQRFLGGYTLSACYAHAQVDSPCSILVLSFTLQLSIAIIHLHMIVT